MNLTRYKWLLRCCVGFLMPAAGLPQSQSIQTWLRLNEREVLAEFQRFLSIPNVAADRQNLVRNTTALRQMMEARGIRTSLFETADAPPVVFGEIATSGALRTLVFYAHYDGQPISRAEWSTNPFDPVRKGDRIYARSASDDKAAIFAMLTALDALKASGTALTSSVKFFFEGEEEAGSPHLQQILRQHATQLTSDLWLICDGPVHQSGRQQVYFGARGLTGLEMTVYGPARELHSGHYGGWAPNPAIMLAHLLASMRDESGRVLIPHFSDGARPLTELEKKAIQDTPSVNEQLQQELALRRQENAGRKLEEIVNQPWLNIRGLKSADVGAGARNVIPASATASIDIRLVPGISPADALHRVTEHIRAQGYFVVDREPDESTRRSHEKIAFVRSSGGGYAAAKTPMDLPIARSVIAAVSAVRGPVVEAPTLGGSVPLFLFEQELKAPFLGLPIANHDNNQHSANENIRLQNLWNGVETMAAVMTMRQQ